MSHLDVIPWNCWPSDQQKPTLRLMAPNSTLNPATIPSPNPASWPKKSDKELTKVAARELAFSRHFSNDRSMGEFIRWKMHVIVFT